MLMRAGMAGLGALSVIAMGLGVHEPREGDPPLVQWVGHDTKFEEPGFVIVRTAGQWRELWARHQGLALAGEGAIGRHQAPHMDFDRCQVLAYFRGEATNSDGELATHVEETADSLRVRLIRSTFQTSGLNGGAVSTRPYGIWVLPASAQPVVVEEGRRNLKDQPLSWREVFRAPAP